MFIILIKIQKIYIHIKYYSLKKFKNRLFLFGLHSTARKYHGIKVLHARWLNVDNVRKGSLQSVESLFIVEVLYMRVGRF